MRILRIVYDWPRPWTGLSPAPYELTKSQVKAGHTVDIFSGIWPRLGGIVKISGVTYHPFMRAPLPGTMLLTTAPFMFFYYKSWRKKNKVDIIHCQGHFALWIYVYRNILKKIYKNSSELKTPLVAQFHNTVAGRKEKLKKDGVDVKFYSEYLDWPLAMWSDRLAIKVADAYIFVSDQLRDEAIKYYNADPAKCFVIESGVNTALFTPVAIDEKDKTRSDLKFDQGDVIILNLGAQTERKNIHLLIESMKNLPHYYKLLLVGPCEKEYGIRLETQITQLSLRDRIVRTSETPYPQTPIAYQASDLFVLPSSFEGMPKVIFEALSTGLPVLGSGFKAQEDIVGLNYLRDTDPKIMAEDIQKIIEQHQHVDRPKINKIYSWDVKAKQIEKVYEDVKY